MIDIKNKEECCGCEGCVQICPTKCISFNEDEEGFKYPLVNLKQCIYCNRCEKVCPVIHQSEVKEPLKVFASKNKDDLRIRSSSGGVFTPIAEDIINNGGVVFGAAFDNEWNVRHIMLDKIEDLGKLRKSKYVQSDIGRTYLQAKEYLRKGVPVLFTGVHCQIAGLHQFLRKEYDNLITIDILCHGVPSPMIWRDYLESVSSGRPDEVSFRYKHSISSNDNADIYLRVVKDGQELCNTEGTGNTYVTGFLYDLYNRPSCHACPAKQGKSRSDISLGDYWNIEKIRPEFYDKKGISLVMINTDKGRSYFAKCKDLDNVETSYKEATSCNVGLISKTRKESKYRKEFWKLYPRLGQKTFGVVFHMMEPTFADRVIRFIKRNIQETKNWIIRKK